MTRSNDRSGVRGEDYDLTPGVEPTPKRRPAPSASQPVGRAASSPRSGGASTRAGAGRATPAAPAPRGAGPGSPPRKPPPGAFQSGAVLAAARRSPGRGAHQDHATGQVIKLAIFVVVALGLVVGGIFAVKAMRTPARPELGNDAEAKKIMYASSYDEIRSWLSQGIDRSLVGHSPKQSAELADDLYELNPKKVLAGGGRASMHVVVELPDDKETRGRLIEWKNQWTENYGGGPPETDVGQQYLIVEMPLNR